MNEKELKDITLTDIHAQWLLMQSSVLSFDEWLRNMMKWTNWYNEQKETRPVIDRVKSDKDKKAS